MDNAVGTTLIDNERVKVTRWHFKPGAHTGWHRHEYDYVVVPITTGQLHLKEPGNKERTVDITLGVPYARNVGVEHDVINPSKDKDVIFIEVEMK
jgi:quercetin dioxygenase-like cupin family protein